MGADLTGEASTTIFVEIRVEATHTDRVSSLSGVDLTPAEPSLPPLSLLFHPLTLLGPFFRFQIPTPLHNNYFNSAPSVFYILTQLM